jgi:transposase
MLLIGVDYHPSFQTIAFSEEETGECGEQELNHSEGQAERFYRGLQQRGIRVRVGMEATGYSRWFERPLAELGIEIGMGDPAEIKAKRVKKRKTDRNDALLLLRLLRENNFPQIWVPSPENRDLRQLLWHRHRLLQMRTRIMNQLQALAMNEGYRWKKKLFSVFVAVLFRCNAKPGLRPCWNFSCHDVFQRATQFWGKLSAQSLSDAFTRHGREFRGKHLGAG